MPDPKYKPWSPAENTDGEFHVVWFEDRPGTGVVIEVEPVSHNGSLLRIYFDDSVAYRCSPHDILMKRWWRTDSFFRVENSDWRSWLRFETQQIYDQDFSHFGVKTIDGCYEVLTNVAPRAEWLTTEESLNSDAARLARDAN